MMKRLLFRRRAHHGYGGLFVLLAFAAGPVARGATFQVTTTTDSGAGSLRQALLNAGAAAGHDTLQFTTSGTITLQSTLPVINDDLTILGNGATVSGNNLHRVFFVRSGSVAIQDLTIADGLGKGGKGGKGGTCNAGAGGGAGWGGGLTAIGGTLLLERVTFANNHAIGGAGGAHGGDGLCHFGAAGGGGFEGDGQDGGVVAGSGGAGGQAGGTPGAAGIAGTPTGGDGTGGGGGGGSLTTAGFCIVGSRSGDGGELGGGGGAAPNCNETRGGNGGAGGGGGGAQAPLAGRGSEFGGDARQDRKGGGGGGAGTGGAVHIRSAAATLIDCTFANNSATGGSGGSAGNTFLAGEAGKGKGGAIYIGPGATVQGGRLSYAANTASDPARTDTDNNDVYGTIQPLWPSVVSITRVDPSPTNAATVDFSVLFDLPVSGVDATDFALTATGLAAAGIDSVQGSNAAYTVTVNTGVGEGTLRLDFLDDDSVTSPSAPLPTGGVGVGNGDFTSGEVYAVDRLSPVVFSVAVPDGLSVVVEFSEAMGAAALAPGSYTLSGSGRGTLAAQPDAVIPTGPASYRLQWNSGEMLLGGDVTITVASLVTDVIGNPLGQPDNGTVPGGAIGAPPTVLNVIAQDPSTIDVVFSEVMDASANVALNYTVSGTGKGTLTDHPDAVQALGPNTYRLTWAAGEVTTGGDLTVTAANVFDLAGNPIGSPDRATTTGVGVSPVVTGVQVEDGLNVRVTFSEAVNAAALVAGNYTLSGSGQGTLAAHPNAAVPAGGNTYRLTWTTGEMKHGGDITVTVANVSDLAGNPLGLPDSGTAVGAAVGSGPVVTFTTAAPIVVGGPITVHLTASEPLQPVLAQALSVTNAAVSDLVAVGDGYQFTLTPLVSGFFSVSAAAGAVPDLAGNPNVSSNTLTHVFDGSGPTVLAIDPAETTVISGDDAVLTVTFSEPVTGFDSAADVSVQESGVTHAGVTIQQLNAVQFTITLSQMTGAGVCSVSIPANVAQDAVGNPNAASGLTTIITVNAPVAPPPPPAPVFELTTTTNAADVIAGDAVTFTLTITNTGDADATGVTITFPLTDAEFISARLTDPAGPLSASVHDGLVSVPIGTVPAGAQITIEVLVRPTAGGLLEITWTLSSDQGGRTVPGGGTSVRVADRYEVVSRTITVPFCGAMGVVPFMLTALGLLLGSGRRYRQ